MTQGFGQPGNYGQPQGQGQPGNQGYPQTPGGGFPQAPAYSQAPAYPQGPGGGYPQNPYEANSGPVQRPGATTAAAVLGFVQAGITAITSVIILLGLINAASQGVGGEDPMGWVVVIAQIIGLVLLIFGGIQLMSGKSAVTYLVAVAVELVIVLYYLITILAADAGGIGPLEDLKAAATIIPIIFAVMPVIGLFLALGSSTKQYVQSRRG